MIDVLSGIERRIIPQFIVGIIPGPLINHLVEPDIGITIPIRFYLHTDVPAARDMVGINLGTNNIECGPGVKQLPGRLLRYTSESGHAGIIHSLNPPRTCYTPHKIWLCASLLAPLCLVCPHCRYSVNAGPDSGVVIDSG